MPWRGRTRPGSTLKACATKYLLEKWWKVLWAKVYLNEVLQNNFKAWARALNPIYKTFTLFYLLAKSTCHVKRVIVSWCLIKTQLDVLFETWLFHRDKNPVVVLFEPVKAAWTCNWLNLSPSFHLSKIKQTQLPKVDSVPPPTFFHWKKTFITGNISITVVYFTMSFKNKYYWIQFNSSIICDHVRRLQAHRRRNAHIGTSFKQIWAWLKINT